MTRLQEIEQRANPDTWSGVHELTSEDIDFLLSQAHLSPKEGTV